jgi:hypothetical protein
MVRWPLGRASGSRMCCKLPHIAISISACAAAWLLRPLRSGCGRVGCWVAPAAAGTQLPGRRRHPLAWRDGVFAYTRLACARPTQEKQQGPRHAAAGVPNGWRPCRMQRPRAIRGVAAVGGCKEQTQRRAILAAPQPSRIEVPGWAGLRPATSPVTCTQRAQSLQGVRTTQRRRHPGWQLAPVGVDGGPARRWGHA